jgi:outer membrane protein assembly factor BamB
MENEISSTSDPRAGGTPPASSANARNRFPKRMIAFSILCLAVILVLRFGNDYLNESLNLPPGGANLIQLVLIALVAIAWNGWIAFFSGWRWPTKLIGVGLLGLLPLAGIVFFQPIFDGALGLVRFEPRFGSVAKEYAQQQPTTVSGDGDADRFKQTEFDFPQFLGRDRNATVTNVVLADSWDSQAPEKVWTISVGEGWSGFAIVGDHAFTQEQRDDQELVVCYDIKNGTQVWAHAEKRRHEDYTAMGRVGPRATPTVVEGLVYAVSGTGVLDCLDAKTGEHRWAADVPALVDIEQVMRVNGRGLEYTQENSSLAWGRSTSPLVYKDLVIVPAGGPVGGDAITMIAFDRQTGEERWRGGEHASSYGSPTLINIDDEVQVCLIAEDHAVGHDPDTGEELWAHPWTGNSDSNASCSQITPIDDSLLLLSKGYAIGGQVIRVTREDDEWQTEMVKANSRVVKTKMTNPVILDGYAYSLSDGFLECTQVPDLKRMWKKRGRFGNGQLLLVGDKLLVHAEYGTLHLVATTPEKFQELGKCDTIDGVCWNTIALSGDRLLVRSELEAALIRLPLAEREQDVGSSE